MCEENNTNSIETRLTPFVSKKILMVILGLVLPPIFGWALFAFWNESLIIKLVFSLFFIVSLFISIFGIRLAFSVYIVFNNSSLTYYNSFTERNIPISDFCWFSKTKNGLVVFYKKTLITKQLFKL